MQSILNYSQIKWQLGLSLQVVAQDLRFENLFVETSNAFLRKACTISMRILGKFRLLFCVFLIFVSEFSSLLCQVSEISKSFFSWIWENICWPEKLFLNNSLTFLNFELTSWIVAIVFFEALISLLFFFVKFLRIPMHFFWILEKI